MWNPWAEAGQRWRHIQIVWWHELPEGVRGLVRDGTIWLCRTLTQAERRSTLTHELVHLERGIPHHVYREMEERAVDVETARRLIPLSALIDALRESRDPADLAEALWTDEHTVTVRLEALDPLETAEIEHALEDEWLWIP
ncbi:peptidase [Mycobacterium phage Tortellini]|uniref:Peptidase n=1 Tax=Mycobacterium phage Tortellini TaxID=1897497 RepID=A0A1D8EX16_9CAUD|nr:metallo-protease [Mycobacterium phage Tortellini]AOT25779.1 peptidase [Mycobacterium phage Tortellini]